MTEIFIEKWFKATSKLEKVYNYDDSFKQKALIMWNRATINADKNTSAIKNCKLLLKAKDTYKKAEAVTGVPWWFTGILNGMESDFDMSTWLANGDPLSAPTVQVPKGLKCNGSWLDGAIVSLKHEGYIGNKDWSILHCLYLFESWNGWGYANHGVPSSYVWSSTSEQKPGRFIADHVWSDTAISKRVGCAAMLKILIELGEVAFNDNEPNPSNNDDNSTNNPLPNDDQNKIVRLTINSNDVRDVRAYNANSRVVAWLDTNGDIDTLYKAAVAAGCANAKYTVASLDRKPPIVPMPPKPTTPNTDTGNGNAALIIECNKWIGIHEIGGNNNGPDIEKFQKAVDGKASGEPWCMAFVQFCIMQIEKQLDINSNIFNSEHCLTTWTKSPESMRLINPIPGCIIIWQHGNTSNGHTGFITGINAAGKLLTVEGNTSDENGINRDGDGVYARVRNKNGDGDMKIKGYLKVF
jgi:uncharacterized protein (TIGR02594 family)